MSDIRTLSLDYHSTRNSLPQFDPPPSTAGELYLGIPGFAYRDLYDPRKLRELHELFWSEVEENDAALAGRWKNYRQTKGQGMTEVEISQHLVDLAPHVSDFIARLFGVDEDRAQQVAVAERDRITLEFKRDFLTRRALKKFSTLEKCQAIASLEQLNAIGQALVEGPFANHFVEFDEELATAKMTMDLVSAEKVWKTDPMAANPLATEVTAFIRNSSAISSLFTGFTDAEIFASLIERLEAWSAARALDHDLARDVKGWASYAIPKPIDYFNLVEIIRPEELLKEKFLGPEEHYRHREGFNLTDERMTPRQVHGETDYCIFCHDRNKDSCAKGLWEKDGNVKKNPLGIDLNGCPLDEKISEMHLMRHRGDSIAGLALIIIDNPMCPGTGHRICNDCMKACIYQKQSPVNIPQAETGVLTDVLNMRWGFEIYSFLTRWNPLNVKRPYALPYNGKKVLVVGLGPAGYTLAHFLINEGYGVTGIDGLKIEPLNDEETGYFDESGDWHAPIPVEYWGQIYDTLDHRVLEGFGGVAEYGITVRWDKNFLKVIYLTLARRTSFSAYGGVRFGGTMTIEEAFEDYGFDHIAIATGAGKPTIVPMKNNLLRGMRKASDFLMALQLTGAAKQESMANLQVELPAIVIGGGLTAIDTATELMAYYPVQVEKVAARHNALSKELRQKFMSMLGDEERRRLATFLEHAAAIAQERALAEAEGRKPDLIKLVRSWGGVSLIYRKSMLDSPAYRLNHEEIEKSLEEGIYYIENLSPLEAVPDETGAVKSMIFERQALVDGKWRNTGETMEFPAKTVCVAAGTSPNTIYERERPGTFEMDKWKSFFKSYALDDSAESVEANHPTNQLALKEQDARLGNRAFFTSYHRDGKFITYYGDNHPLFAGNVVKAMASAKQGYPEVTRAIFGKELEDMPEGEFDEWLKFRKRTDREFKATVLKVQRLTRTIVEVILTAPAAARHFEPGQFYRLQNFERLAKHVDGTTLAMEGLALTGAWVDKEKGLLSLIVLEMGSSSRLVAALKPGEPVIIMGPTGTPTEIPENETVLLAGGGLGNAVLFSIAKALKEKNNKVIYFAGYKFGEDLFKREEVEAYTDQVIWSTDAGEEIQPNRPQDAHIRANILEAMIAYEEERLGVEKRFPLSTVDRIIAIGSDRMMAAVKGARREGGVLYKYVKKDHVAIGSINSPMQCMMKEVCAQCLQKHLDAQTQQEKGFVFSCFNQDQHLDSVDFHHLNERLKANSLEEKLSSVWLDHLLTKTELERV